MRTRPPGITRSDTPFPYTTRFRSLTWPTAAPSRVSATKPAPCSIPSSAQRLRARSEEHTSELQSLMRISYAVFCLKKKTKHNVQRAMDVLSVPIYVVFCYMLMLRLHRKFDTLNYVSYSTTIL